MCLMAAGNLWGRLFKFYPIHFPFGPIMYACYCSENASGGQGLLPPVDSAPPVFTYIGRIKSHSKPISGLEFGFREGAEVLVSVGEDRLVCVCVFVRTCRYVRVCMFVYMFVCVCGGVFFFCRWAKTD